MVNGYITSVKREPQRYILSGDPGEGKTSFLLEILSGIQKKGIQVRGIAAPGYFQDGYRSGFSVIDLATGISEELCSGVSTPDCEKHGRFYFRSAGLSFGRRALLDPLMQNKTDLLVIDEVGWFELNGEVWSDSIDRLVEIPYPPMIWTVRRNLVSAVIARWPVTRTIVMELGSVHPEGFVDELLEEIRIYRLHVSC